MWSSDDNEDSIYINYDDENNLLLIIPKSIQMSSYRIQSNIQGMRMIVREEAPAVTKSIQSSRILTPVRNNTTTAMLNNAF